MGGWGEALPASGSGLGQGKTGSSEAHSYSPRQQAQSMDHGPSVPGKFRRSLVVVLSKEGCFRCPVTNLLSSPGKQDNHTLLCKQGD